MGKSILEPQPTAGMYCIQFERAKYMQAIPLTVGIFVGPYPMERCTKAPLRTVVMSWLHEKKEKSTKEIQVIQAISYLQWKIGRAHV
jgi:hypothetical protein